MSEEDESLFETFDNIKDAENSDADGINNGSAEPLDISGLVSDAENTEKKEETQEPQPKEPESQTFSTEGSGEADANAENVDNSSKDSGQSFSTESDTKQESFMSFNDAMKQKGGSKGKKPEKLNKPFITGVLAVVFVIVMVLLVWRPDLKLKKKTESTKTPVADSSVFYDLEKGAIGNEPKDEPKISENQNKNNQVSGNTVNSKYSNPEDPITNKPVVTDPYSAGLAQSQSNTSSQVYISDRPLTVGDSLQSKTINGIKGITSTQNTYISDYELQKIANTTTDPKTVASYAKSGSGSSLGNPNDYIDKLVNTAQGTTSYASQNGQADKNNFYNSYSGSGGNGVWLGVNTIWQGTIFEAVLTSEINTDLPGEVTARIAKNVYSSQDGRYLLIPQNSILIGTYNSNITYNQRRTQVVWTSLIRPDGYQIYLGGMNATDTKGASGLTGHINDHPGAYLKAIMLMSVVNIINSEYQSSIDGTENQYVQNIAANAQSVTNELGRKLIDRAMDIQPTIKIKSGTKINIVVNQNLSIPVVENIPVTEKYQRGKLPKELE